MQFEGSMYSGRGKDSLSSRRDKQEYDAMSSEQEQRDDYPYVSDTYNEKQSERDWDRRMSRERDKSRTWDYPQEDEDDRDRFGKNPKSEYSKRYSDVDRRSSREESDRRPYYDSSPRSRERDRDRDISSSRDGPRDRDSYESSSRDSSRRRDYRDSRSSRDQFDSRDMKDGRTRSSSRDARSGRDRDRRESRNYDKDWDSHDRDRRLKDNGSPESLDSYDRGSDYHGTRSSGDSRYRDGDGYKNQAPNSTIMIRGLAQHITESDIQQDILCCDLMPRDIRLIRKKDTGASRGFAFVEFNTVQEASRWMEMKQGVLMLQDRYRAEMHFSIPKDPSFDRSMLKSGIQDWHCVICGAHNFKRRDTCFKCHASRQVSDEGGEGSDEVSPHPTNTVLLRNLDVLSTEDSVLQALKNQQFSNLPIRSIRIGQDALTNTSRGICYIELNNVLDSVYLHDALVSDPLVVDGRKALVSYCKVPQRTSGTTSNVASDRDSQWAAHADANHQYRAEDIPRLAEYCASLYATSPQERAAYIQYYTQYYKNQLAQGGTITLPSQTQTDSVNAAAAVAQSAIQQLQAAKEIKKTADDPRQGKGDENGSYDVYKMAQLKGHATQAAAAGTYQNAPGGVTAAATSVPYISVPPQGPSGLQKYPVPDVSTYQYDGTSGYYYDSQTGLYYDANSQYYYNAQTQQFLYWEAEKQTYLPAPAANTTAGDDANAQKDDGKKGKGKEKQDKVKVAKKIAKDMERWAKTLNQKKDNALQNVTLASASAPLSKSVGAADAGYAILERKERQSQDTVLATLREAEEKQAAATEAANASATSLVAAYGGGSESDEEIEDVLQEEKQHTNWAKLACLLCKRQFPSKESLIRHQQLSDLHKQNLENWYKVRGLDPHDPQQRNNKYRDRAKERRLKFGEPDPPHPNRLKEKYLKVKEEAVSASYEEPTKTGIGSENVGNKLLQKMGWQEGQGLGKANQGRTSIIQTEQRNSTAGLGSKDSTYGALPGETYKDCVKKMMFARYQELTEQEQSMES
ncbi:RNA-binding protein 10 [Gryllus bimaculatus]|nr:RNA-binding protein 10 [Gryllus bimaculatus]